MAESDEIRREAQELTILSGAFVRLAQRLHDRAKALETAVGGPADSRPGGGDVQREEDPLAPAILMATNLAALGHSREEIRAVLSDSFDLADPEPVLDRALTR
jgi:hypothetical protein